MRNIEKQVETARKKITPGRTLSYKEMQKLLNDYQQKGHNLNAAWYLMDSSFLLGFMAGYKQKEKEIN